ncbi:MAG TPA: SAM-dependent chlorinase/fluorinase [Pyrinomonadaceae bacterium]|nr:SAM-dependent chlorinase/fluorinase [Pyrinomonadaceae bacterium]
MIALLTDFGTADYFVGSVKGVILSINPNATIVDITHEVPPQDIESGAFTLFAAHSAFPPGAIFVAVIDPGVGSERRPIIVKRGGQFFVGPDNGLFSYLYETDSHQTIHIKNEDYLRHPVSPTFHGRDVFAPVAAHLSTGVDPTVFGPVVTDEVRLSTEGPRKTKEHVWAGRIIHIDRFGNCVTNISRELLTMENEIPAKLRVKDKTITSFRSFFAEGGSKEKLFAVWGSAGFLEIAAVNRSAAKKLKVKRGDLVRLETG